MDEGRRGQRGCQEPVRPGAGEITAFRRPSGGRQQGKGERGQGQGHDAVARVGEPNEAERQAEGEERPEAGLAAEQGRRQSARGDRERIASELTDADMASAAGRPVRVASVPISAAYPRKRRDGP